MAQDSHLLWLIRMAQSRAGKGPVSDSRRSRRPSRATLGCRRRRPARSGGRREGDRRGTDGPVLDRGAGRAGGQHTHRVSLTGARVVAPVGANQHRRVDDDWDVDARRPAWVRWVAWIAAVALLLPLAVAAVDLLI